MKLPKLPKLNIDYRETLVEKLNFSATKDNETAIKIGKYHSVNMGETLMQYCADNDIDTPENMREYEACENIMNDFGIEDKSINYFYFWIDK